MFDDLNPFDERNPPPDLQMDFVAPAPTLLQKLNPFKRKSKKTTFSPERARTHKKLLQYGSKRRKEEEEKKKKKRRRKKSGRGRRRRGRGRKEEEEFIVDEWD